MMNLIKDSSDKVFKWIFEVDAWEIVERIIKAIIKYEGMDFNRIIDGELLRTHYENDVTLNLENFYKKYHIKDWEIITKPKPRKIPKKIKTEDSNQA